MRRAGQRCWRYDWVLDLDVKRYFDSIDWQLLLKAVRHHTDCPWMLLYIERWLKVLAQLEDGRIEPRKSGTAHGGVISPLPANLFLHYVFDIWMARNFPHIPFERNADDAFCHCKSAGEAQALWSALAGRFAVCKLVLHPEKTKIVYCKDNTGVAIIPTARLTFSDSVSGQERRCGTANPRTSFLPAASPNALKRISRTVRSWTLHHRNDRSLQDLAQMYNPSIRGWITYYGSFYRTRLRPTPKNIDLYVISWARRKFKNLRRMTKGSRDWFDRLRRQQPRLFAH